MFSNLKGFSLTKNNKRKEISNILQNIIKKHNQNDNSKNNSNIIQHYQSLLDNDNQHHSSCIINIKNKCLAMVWFAGNLEGHFNNIQLSLYSVARNCWTKPQTICYMNFHSLQNPVLYYHENTSYLYLFISAIPTKKGQSESRIIYQSTVVTLDDNQLNLELWSPIQYISNHIGILTKHKPCLLDIDNQVIIALPVYHSLKKNTDDFSSILFCNLNKSQINSSLQILSQTSGLVQPCFIQLENRTLVFFRCRYQRDHNIAYMTGINKLQQFSYPAMETDIPNNNSGFDVLYLEQLKLFLFIHNEGVVFSDRHLLFLSISKDNGHTIDRKINIEPKITLTGEIGDYDDTQTNSHWKQAEFSYPSIILVDDKLVISYSFNRETIKTIWIPLLTINNQ